MEQITTMTKEYSKKNLAPKKMFGQNFLTDKNTTLKILNKADIKNNDNILEIGPGKGFLSDEILKNSPVKNLIAIEIDKDLCEFLEDKFKENKNFYLQKGDCLKKNWEFPNENCPCPNKLIANIPYNITSEIIFKMIEHYKIFENITIMVQNEVADRVVAKHNSKNFGVLTCIVQKFWNVEKFAKLPPTIFYPKPNVDSALLHFTPKIEKNNILTKKNSIKIFSQFIKFCFNQRRKILFNRLISLNKKHENKDIFTDIEYFEKIFNNQNIEIEKLKNFFIKNNLDLNYRPENLSVENFYDLFCFLFKTENL